MGELNFKEPFNGLFCQGMVCHKHIRTRKNWVYPEDVVKENTGQYVHRVTGGKIKS